MERAGKLTRFFRLVCATIAIVIFLSSCWPSTPAGPPPSNLPLSEPTTPAKLFSTLPIGETMFVDFRADEENLQLLTDRQQKDQFRDWLVFTVASDCSFSTQDINQSLYDLSPIRQGYMKPVTNFEYGDTRSFYADNGNVVALLPKESSQTERQDDLAHIADKYRKDVGKIPETLIVFEYELDLEEKNALLNRIQNIDAQDLFKPGTYGYYEAKVDSLSVLQDFMERVDNLTFAQIQGTHLVLGGRKLQSRAYKGIQVEDVATLWQSEANIEAKSQEFSAVWNTKINNAPPELRDKLIAQAQQEASQLKLPNASGFSLDPINGYDFRALENAFQQVRPTLEELRNNSGGYLLEKTELQAIDAGLKQNDSKPYLNLINRIKSTSNILLGEVGDNSTLNAFLNSPQTSKFQAARYDGDLQGTEVGMVLFYTDLLAKMWALDYQSSNPQQRITDFKPLTTISEQAASIYEEEINKLSQTRLWFGSQDKGFQSTTADNSLLFARNATRVYAASSDPQQPGEETTAAANSDAFLGWWNDHYEEIAEYEPQYERLNEIMKWSLLIGWLNNANQGNHLGYLQDVAVKRDNWFPTWVKQNRDQLTFKDWQTVIFYPRGSQNTTTETMPLLVSEPYQRLGQRSFFSGGVSLAGRDVFKDRQGLPTQSQISPRSLRSNLDHSSVQQSANNLKVINADGTTFDLNIDETIDSNTVAARAKPGDTARLRSSTSELAKQEFTRSIHHQGSELDITSSVGGTELGQLRTRRRGNAFTVGWHSRDGDIGQLIAHKLSAASPKEADKILSEHPLIRTVLKTIDAKESYFINLQGSDQWLQLSASGAGGGGIPPWARVSSISDDSPGSNRGFLIRWLDHEEAFKQKTFGSAKKIRGPPTDESVSDRTLIAAEIEVIDTLRQQDQPAQAAERVDALIIRDGNWADLWLRKVLNDIERGQVNVKRLGQPELEGERAKRNLFDAIHQLFVNNPTAANSAVYRAKNKTVYVYDSAGLDNVDLNVPLAEIGLIAPLIDEGRVYRLEAGEIRTAKLGIAGANDSLAQTHSLGSQTPLTSVATSNSSNNGSPAPPNGSYHWGGPYPPGSPGPGDEPDQSSAPSQPVCDRDAASDDSEDTNCNCGNTQASQSNDKHEIYIIL